MADQKELEGIVQRMIDAGESEENIAAVIKEYPLLEGGATGELRPHTPGMVERGLNTLSEAGPVPAMISGAVRTGVVAPIQKTAEAIGEFDDSPIGLGAAMRRMLGNTARVPTEPVNPYENLGAGLLDAAALLSIPSAAPVAANATRVARQGAGRALKSELGRVVFPADRGATLRGIVGHYRDKIGNALMGENAGGRLAGETIDQAVPDALKTLTQEGGRYSEVPLSHPTGGGYTTPVVTGENVGGRLARSVAPPPLEDELTGVLQSLRQPSSVELASSHVVGGGSTVTPADEVTAAMDRLVGQASSNPRTMTRSMGEMGRPAYENAVASDKITGTRSYSSSTDPRLTKNPMKELTKASKSLTTDTAKRYRELALKPILTPQEVQEFDMLSQLLQRQAQQTGLSYAAQGKGKK